MPRETKAEQAARELKEAQAAKRKAAREAKKLADQVKAAEPAEDNKELINGLTQVFTAFEKALNGLTMVIEGLRQAVELNNKLLTDEPKMILPAISGSVSETSPGAEAVSKPVEKTEPKQEQGVNLTQIREKINEKASAGLTAGVLTSLKKVGAQNASGIPADKYDEVYKLLCDL